MEIVYEEIFILKVHSHKMERKKCFSENRVMFNTYTKILSLIISNIRDR